MKSSVVLASAGAAAALAGGALALNSHAYTIDLLPSDPMLIYGNGRGRPTEDANNKWNLTYDGLAWSTYEPGQEWSDKTRFALSPQADAIKVPVYGQRVSVEGTSLGADECSVTTSVGTAESDTYMYKKGEMTKNIGDKAPMRFYTARISPGCRDLAVLSVSVDTLVNVSQKSVEAASHRTETFIGEGDQLTPFFQQSGNVAVASYNSSAIATVPNLGWVSFKAPQYAALMTIRGISCSNCSQFVVQMDPRPEGMDEKLLLTSYSPFTGPATMFVTPLDPGTAYTFNVTGIHDNGAGGAGDALLLKDIAFVVSENAAGGGSSIGAIVGGVVGGVVGAALLGLGLWYCLRRRRKAADDGMTNLKDVSVIDLTHGEIAQVYPSYGARALPKTHTGHASGASSAMALGELPPFQAGSHPALGQQAPYAMSPGAGPQSPAGQAPYSPYGASSAHSTYGASQYAAYQASQAPSSPEHPSTDIPRREITDLDDYFQARDSYMEAEWAEEPEDEAARDAARPAKGELSPPARPAPAVTQERDAGRLVAIPRPRSAALPEYRPSSQFVVDNNEGAPEGSSGPGRGH